jgi:putative transposase
MELLSRLEKDCSLEELNQRLSVYLEEVYHRRKHSSTREEPMERYLRSVSLLRSAPADLSDYFRTRIYRTVGVDRSIRLHNRFFEAPLGLTGQKVSILFDEKDMSRAEVLVGEKSKGFLKPMDLAVNSRIKRQNSQEPEPKDYSSGSLFSGEGA